VCTTTTTAQKDHAVRFVSGAVAAGAFTAGPEHGLPLTRFPRPTPALAHAAVGHHGVARFIGVTAQIAAPVVS
jgi:hypothetical protein